MVVTQKEIYQAARELEQIKEKIAKLKARQDELTELLKEAASESGGQVVAFNGRSGFIVKAIEAERAGLSVSPYAAFLFVQNNAPALLENVVGINPSSVRNVLKSPPDGVEPSQVAALAEIYEPTKYTRLSLKRVTKGV